MIVSVYVHNIYYTRYEKRFNLNVIESTRENSLAINLVALPSDSRDDFPKKFRRLCT